MENRNENKLNNYIIKTHFLTISLFLLVIIILFLVFYTFYESPLFFENEEINLINMIGILVNQALTLTLLIVLIICFTIIIVKIIDTTSEKKDENAELIEKFLNHKQNDINSQEGKNIDIKHCSNSSSSMI